MDIVRIVTLLNFLCVQKAIFESVYTLYIQESLILETRENMDIQFGMLQDIKAKAMAATGANAHTIKSSASSAESVFNEYKIYEAQADGAQSNGGSTTGTSSAAFGSVSMSVDELEAKMAALEEEFARYYAIVNESSSGTNNNPQPENEDDKNKIKPKQFGSMMA